MVIFCSSYSQLKDTMQQKHPSSPDRHRRVARERRPGHWDHVHLNRYTMGIHGTYHISYKQSQI